MVANCGGKRNEIMRAQALRSFLTVRSTYISPFRLSVDRSVRWLASPWVGGGLLSRSSDSEQCELRSANPTDVSVVGEV